MRPDQLLGRRFGMLMVTGVADGPRKPVNVRCDCGVEKVVSAYDLRSGANRSCGCAKRQRSATSKVERAVGQRFGMLTVMGRSERQSYCFVVCDCGVTKEVLASDLFGGAYRSCGCQKRQPHPDNQVERAVGQRFGMLTVMGRSERRRYCFVVCDCGKTKEVMATTLFGGLARSCGCAKKALSPVTLARREQARRKRRNLLRRRRRALAKVKV